MGYSDTEIKAFAEKDLRISKLAITKSLIEKLPLEEIYEVQKVKNLVDEYIDYIYEERSTKRGSVSCVTNNAEPIRPEWEELAIGLNLATPTSQNVKILNQVLDEYKKAHKASANPKDVLVHILNTFGKYPAKTESVSKIVDSF